MAKQGSYGIKEVADVKFYEVQDNVTIGELSVKTINGQAVLFETHDTTTEQIGTNEARFKEKFLFDSLKVSNIEVASEDTYAQGGKGNPKLIGWSYGKEVTFTMEDALINPATLALWLGGKEGDAATTSITIDSNSFPKSYFIVGITTMRSYDTGNDEPFVFVIPKAHIQVNGTVTMEAEGDPSTFEMTIDALSQNVGSKSDVLVQFLRVTSEGAAIVEVDAQVKAGSTEDLNPTTVALTGVTGAAKLDCLGDVQGSIDGTDVTLYATVNSDVGDTAVVNVKDSNGVVVAKINVTIIA